MCVLSVICDGDNWLIMKMAGRFVASLDSCLLDVQHLMRATMHRCANHHPSGFLLEIFL